MKLLFIHVRAVLGTNRLKVIVADKFTCFFTQPNFPIMVYNLASSAAKTIFSHSQVENTLGGGRRDCVCWGKISA